MPGTISGVAISWARSLRDDGSLDALPQTGEIEEAISAAQAEVTEALRPMSSYPGSYRYMAQRLTLAANVIDADLPDEITFRQTIEVMSELPRDLFEVAVSHIEGHWTWPRFPKPGEFRQAVADDLFERQADLSTLRRMRDTLDRRKTPRPAARQRYSRWNKPIALMTAEEKAALLGHGDSERKLDERQ